MDIEQIKDNLERFAKSWSTFVVAVATYLGGKWLGMSEAEQHAYLAQYPVLIPYAPVIGIVLFAIARVLTKPVVTSADKQAMLDELVGKIGTMLGPKPVAVLSVAPAPADVDQNPPVPSPAAALASVKPPDVVLATLQSVVDPKDIIKAAKGLFPALSDADILQAMRTYVASQP